MTVLPRAFEVLTPFVEPWAGRSTAQRAALRDETTAEQRAAFFSAAEPLLEAALDHLDGCRLRTLAPAEQNLMDLMLTLAHVAQAVEIQGPGEAALVPWRRRMRIDRSPADA